MIMEIYGGCCRFSGACAERGLNIFVPIERNMGPWSSVSSMVVQAVILTALMSGAVWYVHLATPCTPWSRARTTSKTAPALDVIWFTAKVLRCCRERNLQFSLENPFGSGLLAVPIIAKELTALKAFSVRYECCAWGASYQKPSELRTNVEVLRDLGRRCKDALWLPQISYVCDTFAANTLHLNAARTYQCINTSTWKALWCCQPLAAESCAVGRRLWRECMCRNFAGIGLCC